MAEHNIKNLLTNIALDMTPDILCNGEYKAAGGRISINENSDIAYSKIYVRSELSDFLFSNTFLDTSDTVQHEFGSIYEVNGE